MIASADATMLGAASERERPFSFAEHYDDRRLMPTRTKSPLQLGRTVPGRIT